MLLEASCDKKEPACPAAPIQCPKWHAWNAPQEMQEPAEGSSEFDSIEDSVSWEAPDDLEAVAPRTIVEDAGQDGTLVESPRRWMKSFGSFESVSTEASSPSNGRRVSFKPELEEVVLWLVPDGQDDFGDEAAIQALDVSYDEALLSSYTDAIGRDLYKL